MQTLTTSSYLWNKAKSSYAYIGIHVRSIISLDKITTLAKKYQHDRLWEMHLSQSFFKYKRSGNALIRSWPILWNSTWETSSSKGSRGLLLHNLGTNFDQAPGIRTALNVVKIELKNQNLHNWLWNQDIIAFHKREESVYDGRNAAKEKLLSFKKLL